MAYTFPDIPTDLWQKWQAELFKKDSQESQDNVFGGFAFRQAADEEIAAIPPVWPNPSDLIALPTPQATATPSPLAVSPTPTPEPFDSSGTTTSIENEPNAFNPSAQALDETTTSFLPSPTFAPTPAATPSPVPEKSGSFLDSANAAIKNVFETFSPPPVNTQDIPDTISASHSDVTDPITYLRNWAANLAPEGNLVAPVVGQVMDTSSNVAKAIRQLIEKVPGTPEWDRAHEGPGGITPLDVAEGVGGLFSPDPGAGLLHGVGGGLGLAAGMAKHGDDAIRAAKLAAEQVDAAKLIEQGIHPLQSFLDNIVTKVEGIEEDVRGNLKYPSAAATARKVIADMKEKGLDTSEAEAAMEDFHMIARSDYERGADGAEEFHGNKRDAWDNFVQAIQDYDLEDTHPLESFKVENAVPDSMSSRVADTAKVTPPVSSLENPEDAITRIAREAAPETIGQHIPSPVEETGDDFLPLTRSTPLIGKEPILPEDVNRDPSNYFLHSSTQDNLDVKGIDYEGSPVWMTAKDVYRPGDITYAIRKDRLDPSKLDIGADENGIISGHPRYNGPIPPEAVVNMGRGWEPPKPPNPPVSSFPTPPEPVGRGSRTIDPVTGAALRAGADIAGATTGAVVGYGDTKDESISPKDRIIGALTGAVIGGTTAHVGGSLVRRVIGNNKVPGAFPLPGEQDVKGITGAIANLTFRGFDKEALRNEERARSFAQKLRAGKFDELPEDARQLKLNTEGQVEQQIKSIGGEHFDDPALREFMVENAVANHYYEGLRGGRQSAAVQQELANAINKTIDDLIADYDPNRSPNAPEVRFIAGQIVAQHRKIAGLQDAMEELTSLPDADVNKGSAMRMAAGKIALEMDRLTGLVGIHAAYGSNTARALQARKNLSEAIHTSDDAAINYLYKKFSAGVKPPGSGESLNKAQQDAVVRAGSAISQLQDMRANGATPTQFNEFWAAIEKNKVNKEDLFKLLRYNSMLSGPRTVEIALASNSLQLMAKAPRDIVATGLAAARGEANVRELRHEWAGALKGFHQGTQAAMQVLMHGATDESFLNNQEITRSLAPRVDPEHWLTKALGVDTSKNLIRVMEIPGRLTQMPDELARHIVVGAELNRQAAREAHNILDREGNRLTGKAWADKVAELTKQPTSAMLKRIEAAGKVETYKGEMGNLGQIVERNLSRIPYAGNIIAPFYRTSYHITSRGVDFSPLGMGATILDIGKGRYGPVMDVIRGKTANPEGIEGQLNPALTRRLHDGMFGTAATMYFASQALQGNISGSGPQDPQKKQMLMAQGWTPYSIKVNNPFDQGKPVWISYANLGPVAIPMALGAAYAEAQTYGEEQNGNDFDKALGTAGDVARRSLSVASEQTYLQSIRSVFDLMNGNSETAGPRFAANLISSLIPFGAAISTLGQTADTKQRRADPGDIKGSIMNRIPGATIGDVSIGRASLPVAQDTLGREIPNSLRGGGAFNPIRASSTGGKESLGLELLTDYGVDYPSIPSTWGGKTLSRDEQRQLQEMMGTNAEIALRQLRSSLEWQTAPDRESRVAMVKAVLNEARNQAGKRFLDLDPLQDTSLQKTNQRNTRQLYAQGRSTIESLPYSPGGFR